MLIPEIVFIEDIIEKKIISKTFIKHSSSIPKEVLLKVLKDPEDRISEKFKIPSSFRSKVLFWAQIYTQFNSNQALIHDKNNLAIVYDALDYSLPSQKSKSALTLETVSKIKTSLLEISKTKRPKSLYAKKLRQHLIRIRLKKPQHMLRKKFFTHLSQNIRVQTGQRDKIFQGILNALPFLPFIDDLFKNFELPHNLLAIAFVESSFNPSATSKVNAQGVWQIMPFISQKLLPQGSRLQSTRNVLLSTVGASHLLAQNFDLLKRWDLAVTAYHSGTKQLILAKKALRQKNIDLAYILKNYKKGSFGFASRNFYSEFWPSSISSNTDTSSSLSREFKGRALKKILSSGTKISASMFLSADLFLKDFTPLSKNLPPTSPISTITSHQIITSTRGAPSS